jgi:hypothetical protein
MLSTAAIAFLVFVGIGCVIRWIVLGLDNNVPGLFVTMLLQAFWIAILILGSVAGLATYIVASLCISLTYVTNTRKEIVTWESSTEGLRYVAIILMVLWPMVVFGFFQWIR